MATVTTTTTTQATPGKQESRAEDQLASVDVVVDEAVAAMAAAEQRVADKADRRKQQEALLGVGAVIIEGSDIRRWRKAAWLTQAELARRVRLPRQNICAWESGRESVPRVHYAALLMVLTAAKKEADDLQAAMTKLNAS